MFASAEEARDYYDDRIAMRQHVVDECELALRVLNVAADYLEEVMAERESGDLLPSSSGRSIDALASRLDRVMDRMGEREFQRSDAQARLEILVEEADEVVADYERAEDDAQDDDQDDIEDVE